MSSCNSAKTLCRQWGERRERLSCSHESNPLKIMLQVNTSGEESKLNGTLVLVLDVQCQKFCDYIGGLILNSSPHTCIVSIVS